MTGGAGLADLLGRYDETDAPGAALCLVDASALALPTTYGDVVADPRADPAVLTDDASSRAIAVRLDAVALADAELLEHAERSLRIRRPARPQCPVGELRGRDRPVRLVPSATFPVHSVWSQADLPAALDREAAADEAALRLRRASRADDGFLSTFLIRPLAPDHQARGGTRAAPGRHHGGVRRPGPVGRRRLRGRGPGLAGRRLGAPAALPRRGLCRRRGGALHPDLLPAGRVARHRLGPAQGVRRVRGAGLGCVAARRGLASAAFAVLVVRHFVDFGYAAVARHADRAVSSAALSDRTSARPALRWAKRTVILPVGERTIALAVLVPLVGARWALGVLLVAGCLRPYTLAGRWGRMRGKPLWLVPAGERAVEHGGLALLVGLLRPGALAAAYLLLAAIALHQYDVVYRRRLTGAVDVEGPLDRVPWWARVVVIAALTVLLPSDSLRWVLLGLGAALGLAAVADSVAWWRSFVRSACERTG